MQIDELLRLMVDKKASDLHLKIAFGLGLAFLLEFIDTSIKTPSDVAGASTCPSWAWCHTWPISKRRSTTSALAFLTNPNSVIGKGFRKSAPACNSAVRRPTSAAS